MANLATPKVTKHSHGKKAKPNDYRAGRKWSYRGLQGHLRRVHQFYGVGAMTLDEMREKHRELHREMPHDHNAKIGPPWTTGGLLSHLNRRHAKDFHAIVERDGLMVMELNLDQLRLIHDEVHGGTQLKPETRADMGQTDVKMSSVPVKPPAFNSGGIIKSDDPVEVRNETGQCELVAFAEAEAQRYFEGGISWKVRRLLVVLGLTFVAGLWIGYAFTRTVLDRVLG